MSPPPARTSLSMTTPWPGREGSSPGRLPGRAVVPKKEEKEGCCIFLMVVISWYVIVGFELISYITLLASTGMRPSFLMGSLEPWICNQPRGCVVVATTIKSCSASFGWPRKQLANLIST
ncbi:unnamed protein product [Musa hybrid cultivar]